MPEATINIPGSKSGTNRALLLASLCNGTSTLQNCLLSDDTVFMSKALKLLGVNITQDENTFTIQSTGEFAKCDEEIFLGNAGTAVRFLTAACCINENEYTITGDEHMQKRPINELVEALKQAGVKIECINNCPPIHKKGGKFKGGKINIDGSISSQYISALLMIAGKCCELETQINIIGELTSKPYVDITIQLLKEFGVEIVNNNYESFNIKCGQTYIPQNYIVEGDYSSASYFALLALLHNTKITLKNLNPNSPQGDKRFLDVLIKSGAKIEYGKNEISICGSENIINIAQIDMNDIPDMVPTMAILAALTEGETKITNVANLRIKETDRLQALENELNKIGVKTKTTSDSISIWGNKNAIIDAISKAANGIEIETYHDHRIAMSFGCLATVVKGLKIINPNCVQKSYPTFWADLESLQLTI